MKLDNLLFSVIILFLAIVALAILVCGVSFLLVSDINAPECATNVDAKIFIARAITGVAFMGVMNGLYKLWDLFAFCMRNAPT